MGGLFVWIQFLLVACFGGASPRNYHTVHCSRRHVTGIAAAAASVPQKQQRDHHHGELFARVAAHGCFAVRDLLRVVTAPKSVGGVCVGLSRPRLLCANYPGKYSGTTVTPLAVTGAEIRHVAPILFVGAGKLIACCFQKWIFLHSS